MNLALVLPLLAALACAPKQAADLAPPPASPTVSPAPLPDGTLPRPYTAEQIRDALPDGSRIVLTVSEGGQPPIEQRWTFQRDTATTTAIVTEMWAGGALVGEPTREVAAWAELVEHAAFPAGSATRTETAVDAPLGHFDAWLYTVTEVAEDGVPIVSRYWFARTLPGPPILLTVERQGVEVMRLAQITRTTGG